MTLSTLICTKCSSPVAVSGRGVTLPFVCHDCQYFNQQEYDDMAPKETPSASCGCNTASVEATTQLIANLELQLEGERTTIILNGARIAELEMQLLEAKDDAAATKIAAAIELDEADLEYQDAVVALNHELEMAHEYEERSYRTIDRLLEENDDLKKCIEELGGMIIDCVARMLLCDVGHATP
jgi:hypothetical protein